MTQIKQQAIDIIQRMPDKSMVFVVRMLSDIEANPGIQKPNKPMENFFAAAGKINIDKDAVEK